MDVKYIYRNLFGKVKFISFQIFLWLLYFAPMFLLLGKKLLGFSWFPYHFVTLADKVVGLKSIAAYRSGLEINTNVTLKEAEEGLSDVLRGEYQHVQLNFIVL